VRDRKMLLNKRVKTATIQSKLKQKIIIQPDYSKLNGAYERQKEMDFFCLGFIFRDLWEFKFMDKLYQKYNYELEVFDKVYIYITYNLAENYDTLDETND
jgi:hypothetical protein